MKLNEIKTKILNDAKERCRTAEKDYYQGCDDCRKGIYDKWYRYNRCDEGQAYDAGWMYENIKVQNEIVIFIEMKI